jgi:hypothetical protein
VDHSHYDRRDDVDSCAGLHCNASDPRATKPNTDPSGQGGLALDAPTQTMFSICQSNPDDGVRRLKVLFSSGATHPRLQKGDGNTPLHLAVLTGSSEVRYYPVNPSQVDADCCMF